LDDKGKQYIPITYDWFVKRVMKMYKITKFQWQYYQLYQVDYSGPYNITNYEEFTEAISVLGGKDDLNIILYKDKLCVKTKWCLIMSSICLVLIIYIISSCFVDMLSGINIITMLVMLETAIPSLVFSAYLYWGKKDLVYHKNTEYQILSIIQKSAGRIDDKDITKIKQLLETSNKLALLFNDM
jgi:hypothetical protein